MKFPSLYRLFSKQNRSTELTFEDIARGLGTTYKKIIVLTGAGISVNSGIPDFRSPMSGLYRQLPHAEELLFDFNYFRKDPVPFFTLLRAFYRNARQFKPTAVHYFIRLLYEKKLLLRNYTQNVDSLEILAGLPPSYVVEAHGTLRTCHCLSCRKQYDTKLLKGCYLFCEFERIDTCQFGVDRAEQLLTTDAVPTCPACAGILKPDVCFFNESAFPATFWSGPRKDFPSCDLVIIMGTSLQVQPFASLYHRAPPNVPRLVINKTHTVPVPDYITMNPFKLAWRLVFGFPNAVAYPSMMYLGDCDEAVLKIVALVGWEEELVNLMRADEARFRALEMPLPSGPALRTEQVLLGNTTPPAAASSLPINASESPPAVTSNGDGSSSSVPIAPESSGIAAPTTTSSATPIIASSVSPQLRNRGASTILPSATSAFTSVLAARPAAEPSSDPSQSSLSGPASSLPGSSPTDSLGLSDASTDTDDLLCLIGEPPRPLPLGMTDLSRFDTVLRSLLQQ